MKSRFTSDIRFNRDEMILKAQRHIVGNVEFQLDDGYYAMIDFSKKCALQQYNFCDKMDAVVMIYVSEKDFAKLALFNTPYRAVYDLMSEEQQSKAIVGLKRRIQNLEYTDAIKLLDLLN
ncbi:MAG: hypothetical protein ACRC3J_05145 [Culicoidibacterales bacterium]